MDLFRYTTTTLIKVLFDTLNTAKYESRSQM